MKRNRDVPGLLELLSSKDIRTRAEATRALGDIGDPVAMPALTAVLMQNCLVSEQVEAAEALGKFTDPSVIDVLLRANAASIEREIASIDQATAPQAKPSHRSGYYVNQISAEEYTLRSAIAQSLGKIGGTRAVDALFEMLVTEKGWMASIVLDVIRQVIAQTVERENEAHARILVERLGHESKDVRQWAAYCLRYCRDQAASSALMKIAWDEKEEFPVREAALGTLGKIADESALDGLDELALNPNRTIARLAAHAAIEVRQRRQLSNEQA